MMRFPGAGAADGCKVLGMELQSSGRTALLVSGRLSNMFDLFLTAHLSPSIGHVKIFTHFRQVSGTVELRYTSRLMGLSWQGVDGEESGDLEVQI